MSKHKRTLMSSYKMENGACAQSNYCGAQIITSTALDLYVTTSQWETLNSW